MGSPRLRIMLETKTARYAKLIHLMPTEPCAHPPRNKPLDARHVPPLRQSTRALHFGHHVIQTTCIQLVRFRIP